MKQATMTGFLDVFTSGRTRPILIEANEADGTSRVLVAKLTGRQFDKGALTRELVASKLAMYFGLDTPVPFLLNIPPNYQELNLPADVELAIQNGFFPTFATEYIRFLPAFTPDRKLHERHVPLATEIFTFDALIVNRDRTEYGSVNCLTDSTRFVLLDHETALDDRLIGTGSYMEPWLQGSLSAMTNLLKHIFFDSISGQGCDFEPIRAKWLALDQAQVDVLLADVPAVWDDENRALQAIRTYLRRLVENLSGALDEVQEVLR